MKAFMAYLEEKERNAFRYTVHAVILPEMPVDRNAAQSGLNMDMSIMGVGMIRSHMIQCAVYFDRLEWLEGIGDEEIREALKNCSRGGSDLMELWEKH